MEKIDKGMSNYEYLKSVDQWLKEATAGYTRIFRFFYPAFTFIVCFGLWFLDFEGPIAECLGVHASYTAFVFVLPLCTLLVITTLAGFMSLFGRKNTCSVFTYSLD